MFLHRFTKIGSPFIFYEWQNLSYTDENGEITVYKSVDELSECGVKTKGYYTFTTTIDNIGEEYFLVLNLLDCDVKVYFDDRLTYSCDYMPAKDHINMNNIELPFPDYVKSCDITVKCSYRNIENAGLFPPMLKVTSDHMKDSFMLAAANYYAIPSGILAFIFIFICGIYLFGLSMGRTDHSLIVLALAAAALSAYDITMGDGGHFLPIWLFDIITCKFTKCAIPAAVILYVIINRKKKLFRYFVFFLIGLSLLACIVYGVSYVRGGVTATSINHIISGILYEGINNNFIHWLTVFVVAACALSALLYHVFSIADTETKARLLKTQNDIAKKSYETLLKSFRQSSGLRHRQKSDMIAMKLMYDQNKISELGEYLDKIMELSGSMPRIDFSDNYTVNSIVQYAFAEAQNKGIKFNTDISVPDELKISDGDLCTLLVNMLDNAVEACMDTTDEREKTIELRIKYNKGFLSVMCRNTCPLNIDTQNGTPRTTKRDKLNHGFGLDQMERVAKKYNSLLDINRSNGYFTVQTSLRDVKVDAG